MIDLYSDTMTKPTAAMRKCMAEAEVGDEQMGEDPTVNRLQDLVAELLGKEAAVYLPSGTMCNEVSFAVWARTGDEMIVHRDSHPVHFEAGGPAYLARMMLFPVDGPRGIFGPAQVEEAIRPDSPHYPRSRIVEIENTHNMGGGSIWPLPRTMVSRCRPDGSGCSSMPPPARASWARMDTRGAAGSCRR